MTDITIQTKTCPHCQSAFAITQWDVDFYAKISPTFAGQKFSIPTPTLCPACRQRRRMAFRNERSLYRRTCDASGKQIISMYAPKEVLLGDSPDKPYKVYDQKIRFSDSWDPMDYGRDFDFSKSFTENYHALSLAVPRPSMYNFYSENSDYCNCSSYQKDCYLTSAANKDEHCMYASYINDCNHCLDAYMTFDCENSYMTIDCEKSYGLHWCNNCRNCSESYFLTNCHDCHNCFDCYDLENKSYCFANIQLSKEEYQQKIQDIHFSDFLTSWSTRPQGCAILFSDNCSWSHIRNAKNSHTCSNVNHIENCHYCTWFNDSRDCYDIYSRWEWSELCYEWVAIGEHAYQVLYSTNVSTNSQRVLYSMHCKSCSDCFGCCGLSQKSYCIFNKQYSKEEYELTVAKIISHMIETGEWWEFFHPSLSPFGYNETVAQEYYPTQRGGLDQFGYRRSDYEAPRPLSDKVIQWQDLPHTIEEAKDDILQYAIACAVTGKLFRIQPQELAFYRKHHIPLPRKHPDQRHLERLAMRR